MQYTDAIKDLRSFANEPLDSDSLLTTNKTLDLRIAIRTVLKHLDSGKIGQSHHLTKNRKQSNIPGVKDERKSRREKVVDFIRENSTPDKGLHSLQIFKEFRINPKDMMRDIANSYGILSYTRDKDAWITFYFLAETKREFDNGPLKGKLPVGHNFVGEPW